MDLSDLTIKEAREKLHKKEFSAAELVQASLERITAIDPQIHAFLTVAQKEATKAAQDADQLIAQGVNKPLLGIPVAAKDLYSTQNIRTTAGAKIIEHYIPPYDATAVCRLKE